MTCKVAVTLEFPLAQPLTWRGVVRGGRAHTVVHRAVVLAMEAYPGRHWSSLVVCVLERVDEAGDVQEDDSRKADGEALSPEMTTVGE